MGGFLSSIAVPIALAAVAFVLLLGLINMMRGGSPNTSQRLMRLRVLLQFVAIVVAMMTMMATNWSSTRSRMSFCEVFGEPPRIMLNRPRTSTIATAIMAAGTR